MVDIAALPTPPDTRDLQALEDEITELAAHIHAATYRFLVLIREFDEQSGWSGPGLKSCAHWLSWKCGIDLGAAREKVRVAHALKGLPRISETLRTGRVSFSKVRAMTRVATPDNEDYLMMIADHGTASHVERLVRNYRSVNRTEALEAENHRHDLRELSWYFDDDGSYVIKARLTPEQGARVVQTLDAAMEAEFEEREDVSAETPIAHRRADALERLAEGFLTGNGSPATGGDRCTLHVHTDMNTLRAEGDGAEAELASSGRVCAERSRRLACDSAVVPWQEAPDGGETKLNNLVLLCRHHHRLVHEGGYGVEMQPDDTPVFTDSDGAIIPTGPDVRFRGNVFALTARHRQDGLAIGPQTPIPDWDGAPMDDAMAVEGLLQRE